MAKAVTSSRPSPRAPLHTCQRKKQNGTETRNREEKCPALPRHCPQPPVSPAACQWEKKKKKVNGKRIAHPRTSSPPAKTPAASSARAACKETATATAAAASAGPGPEAYFLFFLNERNERCCCCCCCCSCQSAVRSSQQVVRSGGWFVSEGSCGCVCVGYGAMSRAATILRCGTLQYSVR
jgi:hypothetical protein